MAVRVSMVDLNRRVAVVRASDDGRQAFPHVLRGTLAAMLSDAGWHVVVAFEPVVPDRRDVAAVVEQARRWAGEKRCRLSVTTVSDALAVFAAES